MLGTTTIIIDADGGAAPAACASWASWTLHVASGAASTVSLRATSILRWSHHDQNHGQQLEEDVNIAQLKKAASTLPSSRERRGPRTLVARGLEPSRGVKALNLTIEL